MATNSNDSIPSWDEFRNDEELDYDEVVEEPNENQDYGPSLPPGFVQDDSNELPLARHNNFPSLPTEQDDPEDPITNGSKFIVTQRAETDELPSRGFGPDEPTPSRVARSIIGPSLPPEFLPTNESNNHKPVVMGPSLPIDFLDPDSSNDIEHVDEPSCSFNTKRNKPKSNSLIDEPCFDPILIGPSISKKLQPVTDPQLPFDESDADNSNEIGPQPNGEADADDIIGPMPPTNKDHDELEYLYRLHEFETKQASKPGQKREQWMTEPPKKLANFGLNVPRSFSKNGPNSDNGNLWTSTPNDNLQPNTSAASSSKSSKNDAYDLREQQRAAVYSHNRKESLLDVHRKRKLDGQGSSNNSGERRPFNRETDMAIHGLSGKMNTEEIKQRMDLSSRFNHGSSTNKFL